MSDAQGIQAWEIHAPEDWVYTPAEIAGIARAVQAFEGALNHELSAKSTQMHAVSLHRISVLDGRTPVDWPQPGDPVVQLAPCPVCGRGDWPEGGQRAARNIHMRAHERQGQSIPEYLEGAEVAQWLADQPMDVSLDPA